MRVRFNQLSQHGAFGGAGAARAREQWAKVERHYDGIISVPIALESLQRSRTRARSAISISIGVPGRDIVVRREQRLEMIR